MKSKVTATAIDGVLDEIVIQGDTDSLCRIWTAVSYAVGGRLAREKGTTLPVALEYLGELLEDEIREVQNER